MSRPSRVERRLRAQVKAMRASWALGFFTGILAMFVAFTHHWGPIGWALVGLYGLLPIPVWNWRIKQRQRAEQLSSTKGQRTCTR
jgi:hypothetical protein